LAGNSGGPELNGKTTVTSAIFCNKFSRCRATHHYVQVFTGSQKLNDVYDSNRMDLYVDVCTKSWPVHQMS